MMTSFPRVGFPTLAFLCLFTFSCTSERGPFANGEKPEDNRFTPVILASGVTLDEPMAFEVLSDERVFIIERKGGVKLYDPDSETVKTIAEIAVNTKYTNAEGLVREAEEGLVGLTVHPNFSEKPWVYLLYAHPNEAKHVLTRWNFENDQLVESSKIDVLEFPVQREECCHTGGGMVWDKDQNLFITVGNNTSNVIQSQTDERPGKSAWDDQRGASNTNDLRGKILRIHPEDDGTYSIPEGNLFPPGTDKTRPEIYSMGHRNAWRISIDSKTGYVYWGEVGPDATNDSELGPRGYDELNQGRGPANHGWPYFVGDNMAFPFYDFVADSALAPKDPNQLTNNSVNNTGLVDLPPALPAFISYPYGVSEEYPILGNGGRSATGGPIYREADFKNAERPFPNYFEGKWIAADLARGWLMSIDVDDDAEIKSIERFMPNYKPAEIIDIKFGPNGDLYILEYGSRWFRDSEDDKLLRIEFNPGNRKPQVAVAAAQSGGTVPFETQLSPEGSKDYDGDDLSYQWTVSKEGEEDRVFDEISPTVSFDSPGEYLATLLVTDPSGESNSSSLSILAGNEPPKVDLDVSGNQDFFFPNTAFNYDVKVSDFEDGAIDPSQVALSLDYVTDGFDLAELIQGQRSVDASTKYSVAKSMIASTDCAVCHQPDLQSAGPSYKMIADKYDKTKATLDTLASKVVEGGSGVWGEVMMPAHPALSVHDARTIVDYILNIESKTLATLPLNGSQTPGFPEEDAGTGSYVLRAAYQDRGAGDIASLTDEKTLILRSPILKAEDADLIEGARTVISGRGGGPMNIIPTNGNHIAFKDVDMTGIKSAILGANASNRSGSRGGLIEIRLGSVDGEILGQQNIEVTQFSFRRRGERPEPVIVPLTEQTGRHDLYFVFKNDEASAIDPLMSFSQIRFQNK